MEKQEAEGKQGWIMNYMNERIYFYGIRDDQSKKRIFFYSFDVFKNYAPQAAFQLQDQRVTWRGQDV